MRTPGEAGVVAALYKAELPLTRENYIAYNWAGLDTRNWTDEDEAELPPELQDWSLFKFDPVADRVTYIGPPAKTRAVDYDPNQARAPKGSAEGGEWISEGAEAGAESTARAAAAGLPHARSVRGSSERLASPSHADLTAPLQGLPRHASIPGHGNIVAGPHPPARAAAYAYCHAAGIDYHPPGDYVKVDPARATRIAAAFDAMPHDPQNPEVKAAYAAMISETIAQWHAIAATGLDVDWIDFGKTGDPYAASPRLATEDVINNNHLWVFPTSDGFGSDETVDVSDNPLLADTGIVIKGHRLVANDVFRIVHDYFGHVKEGNGFRADGEENAWRSHSAMFTPQARRAMTSETRGQNSWVNYGPYGESNRSASGAATHYADQKVGLMPDWTMTEGSGQPTQSHAERQAELYRKRRRSAAAGG